MFVWTNNYVEGPWKMVGSEINDIEPLGHATAASDNSLLVLASSFAFRNLTKTVS
jgi:hypothetical protein